MPTTERTNAIKCYEHRNSLATAMSVDYTGEWVLLAGRRNLALQRLDGDGTLRKYSRDTKYEISAAEFAICPNRQEFCAIATTEHIDIVTWGAAEPRNFYSLRGHTRTVTDIDWHSKNPNLLVSCSIDTFSHIWDLRDPKKPTLSLNAVCMSGATQVGFNRVSGNLLAAAHDGDLRIWDIRKGTCPLYYITAHLSRVHGINWSHLHESCLATASQDGTVKYFNVNNPRKAEKIIETNSPVWRARYTPVGNGLVSITVPHLSSRGENFLLLWSNNKTEPICSFMGHTDVILDFAWRPNRPNQMEIELVTWSRDRSLRVWKIDETMLKKCEADTRIEEDTIDGDSSADTPTNFHQMPAVSSSTPSSLSPFRRPSKSLAMEAIDALQNNVTRSPICTSLSMRINREQNQPPMARSLTDQPTCLLHHEFSLLNRNIPHVEVTHLNAIKRYAVFKISAGGHEAILEVNFPTEYPSPNVIPTFVFGPESTIADQLSGRLLKSLKTTALQRVKKTRTCLEQCLKALVKEMKEFTGAASDLSFMRLPSPRLEGALSAPFECIPFPRTSCARFNATGLLATFAQTLNSKILTLRHSSKTKPRALSSGGSLLVNVQPVYTHRDSNTSYYRLNSKTHSKSRSMSNKSTIGDGGSTALVRIYEANRLLNISKEMAKLYSLDKTNLVATCQQNRLIAESNGRLDLVPIWTLAEMIATPNTPHEKYEMFLYRDPFKKLLLEALIMHFALAGDLQTSVILSCIFHKCATPAAMAGAICNTGALTNPSTPQSYQSKLAAQLMPTTSPYHTVLPVDHQASHPKVPPALTAAAASSGHGMLLKQLRSNSWSDSLGADLDVIDAKLLHNDAYSSSLIRRSKTALFDHFKRSYADILFGWQLLTGRALILKHTIYAKTLPQGIEFVAECASCNKTKRSAYCGSCRRPVMYCSLCRMPVRGRASSCLACGHGGHLSHMLKWFENHDICPSGCGCECLDFSSQMIERMN